MKNTVNLEKIEKSDTELLEKMILACAQELRKRSLKVADMRCDRNDDEGKQLYDNRREKFDTVETILKAIPPRVKWKE